MNMAARPRRGSVLIVALGTLSVLAVFAFIFVAVARSERSVSSNYVDMVRARMLAVSGMEAAMARLRTGVGTKSWDALNETWSYGLVNPASQSFPPNEPLWKSLELAQAPAFCVRVGGPNSPPAAFVIDGNAAVGYSGSLPGTYMTNGDQYAVKITDCAGKICLNMREPNSPPAPAANPSTPTLLATLLANLGQAIQSHMAANPNMYSPLPAYNPMGSLAQCTSLVLARDALPGKQFTMFEQIKPYLPPPGSVTAQDHFDFLRNFITVYGWADKSVITPKPSGTYNNVLGPIPQDFSYQLAPGGRVPVNVNTAPIPVIAAVLTGLRGVALANGAASGGGIYGGGILAGRFTALQTSTIQLPEALAIANSMAAYRQATPFKTWQQFKSFVNGDGDGNGQLDPTGLPNSVFPSTNDARQHRGLILAMANPNTRLQKFNPSRAMCNSAITGSNLTDGVEKVDLQYYTTEFCLMSAGYFELESISRVIAPSPTGGATLRASYRIRSVVKVFDLVRLTTQSDFASNKYGTGFQRTVTYPENLRDRTGIADTVEENFATASGASTLDGQIGLKDRLDTNLNGNARWVARLDDDVEGTDSYVRPNPYPGLSYRCLEDTSMFNPVGRTSLTTNDISPSNEVDYCSDLFPDGLYTGQIRNRMPAWSYSPTGPTDKPVTQANIRPDVGSIGWWVKPVSGTGGQLAGVAGIIQPGRNLGVYSGSFFTTDIYGVFLTKDWLNGGHCSKVSGGYILANTHFLQNFNYPYSSDYFVLQTSLNWNAAMGMSEWHFVQFRWNQYYSPWEVLVDGQLVYSGSGYLVGPGGYVYLNTTNITDDMQISQLFLPSYWGSVWKYTTEGTVDNLTTYGSYTTLGLPNRYDPTNGGSSYEGRVQFPAGTPSSVRVLALLYTQQNAEYRANGASIPPGSRPHVRVTATLGAGTFDCGKVGDGTNLSGVVTPIDTVISTTTAVTYKATWYDEGVTPANVCAYLDDVTLTYTSGPKFLLWYEGD